MKTLDILYEIDNCLYSITISARPMKTLPFPAAEVTVQTPKFRQEDLVCLVIDCGDPQRKFKVIPAEALRLDTNRQILHIDPIEGYWRFDLDPDASIEKFWCDDPEKYCSPTELTSFFPNTEFDHSIGQRVGIDLRTHKIPIGKIS